LRSEERRKVEHGIVISKPRTSLTLMVKEVAGTHSSLWIHKDALRGQDWVNLIENGDEMNVKSRSLVSHIVSDRVAQQIDA
jgi:hypothetical protein